MRILHLSKYYSPFNGGLERVVQDYAESLVKLGHEVTVLCSNESNKFKKDIINGVNVIRIPRLITLAGQPLNYSVMHYLQIFCPQFDIVHLHAPNPLFEFSLLFMHSIRHKLVITHHSDIVRQKLLLKLYRPFQKKFYEMATKIIVPTQNHIHYSNILPNYANKCALVPFGLEESNYPKKSQVAQSALNLRSIHGSFALFVGRLVGYKGLDILINAIENTNLKLVIIGEGPMRTELEVLTMKNGIEDRVLFLGRATTETLANYMVAAEMVVLSSTTSAENFGMVQLEAMMYGKPLVVSNLKSGASSVIIPNETGLLVTPSDSQDLARAINTLMKSPELRRSMGEKGRKLFENKYQLSKTSQKLVVSYLDVIKDHQIQELNNIRGVA